MSEIRKNARFLVGKFINFTVYPAFYVIIFLASLSFALIFNPSGKWIIIFISVLSCAVLVLFFLKKYRFGGIFVLSMLALAFAFITGLGRNDLMPGCSRVTIASKPYETGGRYEFLVKGQNGQRAVLQTDDDKLLFADKIEICFEGAQLSVLPRSKQLFYLARYKTPILITNARPTLIESGSGILRILYFFNDYLGSRLAQLFHGESATLGRGLILGGSGGFSQSFKANLQNSGTSHLVAVSGYNVSIITIMLFGFLRAVSSRRLAITSTIVTILLFCLLTGGTASVVRSSIMGLLFVLAKVFGRRSATLNSLFVAAFGMVLLNPYIIFDVGFQLSFAATLGLIMGSGIFSFSVLKKSRPFLFSLIEILLATTLAQLFTLPILLGVFGKASLVAPIANILILPFIPLAMALVALTIVFSFVPYLSVLAAELTSLLLKYIIYVINYFGTLPFAKIENVNLNTIVFIAYYAVLLLIFVIVNLYRKKQYEKTA